DPDAIVRRAVCRFGHEQDGQRLRHHLLVTTDGLVTASYAAAGGLLTAGGRRRQPVRVRHQRRAFTKPIATTPAVHSQPKSPRCGIASNTPIPSRIPVTTNPATPVIMTILLGRRRSGRPAIRAAPTGNSCAVPACSIAPASVLDG